MIYQSTKTYTYSAGFSCAFRQWRASSHCHFLHGYALQFKLVFEADELDDKNWVVDFGSLKSFKQWLEHMFDHTTLVATDDPMYLEFCRLEAAGLIQMRTVKATGCEAIAALVFDKLERWLESNEYWPRVRVHSVQVSEHQGNSALAVANK